jgi:hypothetical protein
MFDEEETAQESEIFQRLPQTERAFVALRDRSDLSPEIRALVDMVELIAYREHRQWKELRMLRDSVHRHLKLRDG